MFTGLVEELGTVRQVLPGADSSRLTIGAARVLEGTRAGDSIAVNGVCLTATSLGEGFFTADVMAETLKKTNLGQLRAGERVNLERALRLDDRLGGHLVSGHVDAVGRIRSRRRQDIAVLTTIEAPPDVLRYLVPRGSVAVDGVSLTVVEVGEDWFSVSLIPHTAGVTTLGLKREGARVNLEADMLARYVERLLRAWRAPGEKRTLDRDFLAEHGFLD